MKIAILTGGESSEREIALQSAQNVAKAVSENFETEVFDFPTDLDRFVSSRSNFDCCVPVFHGKGGEDGVVQGMLRMLNVPFVFSDVEAHAIGLNKLWTKQLVDDTELKTPKARFLKAGDTLDYPCPVVIKPNDGGSSIGVTIARDQESLDQGLKEAAEYCEEVLVEDFVEGDEYTVAMIDEDGSPTALPVIRIVPKTDFFDYDAKYTASLVEEICPAPINDELREKLQHAGVVVHNLIGARHLSRSDFIVDSSGDVWFLEINTIPGQTLNSLVPKAIRASGRNVSDVFAGWIREVVL